MILTKSVAILATIMRQYCNKTKKKLNFMLLCSPSTQTDLSCDFRKLQITRKVEIRQ